MQLTYQPDGQDPQTWSFRPRKLRSAEAEAIEGATGLTLDEFYIALLKGSMKAQRAAVWTLLKRDAADLKFAQVDLCADEVTLKLEPDEAQQFREALEDSGVDDDLREQVGRLIDQATADGAPAKPLPLLVEDRPFGRAATG